MCLVFNLFLQLLHFSRKMKLKSSKKFFTVVFYGVSGC